MATAVLVGESIDSDKREAERLLQDLRLLRSSESSLLRATMTSSRDDDSDDERVRLQMVGTIGIQVSEMRVAAELVEVLRRVMENEDIRCFQIRNPTNVRGLDFLVKFAHIILYGRIPANDAVSVVAAPRRTNWVTTVWEWIFGRNNEY